MTRKKKYSVKITKQVREAEWGIPIFSAVMQRKVKEIFRSLRFQFLSMKVIILGIVGMVLSIAEIIFFLLYKKDSWIYWVPFFLAILLMFLVIKRIIVPLLLMFLMAYFICKSRQVEEIEFFEDCVSVFIDEQELENYLYENLDKVRILPKETWLIFRKHKVLLLPEYSIVKDQQNILNYLQGRRPEATFYYGDKIVD
ncbi:hypothetical protein [Cuneatibacter caecimuris]|uniref:YcxB-like protein n=1 Tax=Cuneatibacter caecimuris TaxID=1796618 RepID=A0A4Q7PPM2_9FIRM|nr:hypothetical protein [Cuneatibacter caecimuris]RZT02969.1 hypothetical protein EV209_1102 [Cuneatibacter caecimuris]